MAFGPIQYFRKEDFPEIADQPWAQRFFTKLNEMARQTQYGMDKNLSVTQNLSGFWWEGVVGALKKSGIVYPYVYDNTIPNVTPKTSVSIQAFPFSIPNRITPKKINGVFVAQAVDVTAQNSTVSLPALAGAVAWKQEADTVKIYGIDGMVTGTDLSPQSGRCYFTRLLLLSE